MADLQLHNDLDSNPYVFRAKKNQDRTDVLTESDSKDTKASDKSTSTTKAPAKSTSTTKEK